MVLSILPWVAVATLSVGYWFQVWKIHIHKEVRDISLVYNILLAIGFGILGFTAYQERALIFLVKQAMTIVPVTVIIFQVLYHKNDTWHDDALKGCTSCSREMERRWKFCPYCGEKKQKTTSN